MTSPEYAHHFSHNNIPFGIASSPTHETPQAATRLQNTVIFLNDLVEADTFSAVHDLPKGIFAKETLNEFASLPKSVQSAIRSIIRDAFSKGGIDAFPAGCREDVRQVTMHLPVNVGDFIGMCTTD
jgi:fumarylacetoacetase